MEEWRDVVGFEGRYEVSNLGNGRGRRGPIKAHLHSTGRYLNFVLWDGERYRYKLVHRAVLEAFVGPCPEGLETRHLNDDPKDNRLENLAWGTHRENCADRRKNGVDVSGEANPSSRLTDDDVRAIRADPRPYEQIGMTYGIGANQVYRIKSRRQWGHVVD